MPTAVADELEVKDTGHGTTPPPRSGGRGGDGAGGGNSQPAAPARSASVAVLGMYLLLATITMFFAALSSAYIVRKGLGDDWQNLVLPRVMYLNTAALVLSSVLIERARGKLAAGALDAYRQWWAAASLLGVAFLAGQLVAWRELAEAGVFLATNPSSSFFYVLTGAHGAHLILGVLGLLYVGVRHWERAANGAARRITAAQVAGVYWHFMDGLWVFLLLLLHAGR